MLVSSAHSPLLSGHAYCTKCSSFQVICCLSICDLNSVYQRWLRFRVMLLFVLFGVDDTSGTAWQQRGVLSLLQKSGRT